MKKAAVYAGTENLYRDMITASKSLRLNSSVDEIYFLIKRKVFPYTVPNFIHSIDVSRQRYFGINCPNIYPHWTVMTLMKAILTKLFPDHDRILILDVDTIVDGNIDELWDLDLEGYELAGVPEPLKSLPETPYINCGVIMENLKALRENGTDEEIIHRLNEKAYDFAEQDCMNEICGERILALPSVYNSNNFTEPCEEPKIIHYACNRKFREMPMVKKYAGLSWDEIERLRCAT